MPLLERFFDPPAGSYFLFGPRGTGKSTWLRARYPEAQVIDLLRPELVRTLSARPESLREIVAALPVDRVVVLDEVQRVPELLPVVHDLLEREGGTGSARRFVLTGSSARKLRRAGTDLLAGRALLRRLHPFMLGEAPDVSLDQALRHGLLPLVLTSANPEDTQNAYAALYLEEEVRMEGWARRLGDFARFLEVASFSHGSVLNIAHLARQAQVQRNTAANYLEILADLLLGFELPIFRRRAKRALITHPKFYLFDAGVFRSLRPRGPLDRGEEIEGAALEGLVAQHLRAWCDYRPDDNKLFFWRTRGGAEVDFVLYGDTGFYGLEVTNSRSVRPADLRGLRSFGEEYPESRRGLLYRGTETRRVGEVLVIPAERFLRELDPRKDLPLVA